MAKNMYQKREERKAKAQEDNTITKEVQSKVINWYPGHMAKTKKQIIEDLKLIDIVVEVLDARVPKSSKNPDIEQYIKDKKKIVVLNKADLADENITKSWVEYYKNLGIKAIQMEANSGKGINNVISTIKEEYKDIEEKYIKKGRIGRSTRVMVVGIPNVGKSTFINGLAKRNSAKVANRPGVTKQKQWIKIDQNIELMDTPGMLWPRMNDNVATMHLAFVNTIGSAAIDKEDLSFYLIKYLLENYRKIVAERYSIEIPEKENLESTEILEIMDEIANKRGAILPGGKINMQKLSDIILLDFQSGKLGRISIEQPRKINI